MILTLLVILFGQAIGFQECAGSNCPFEKTPFGVKSEVVTWNLKNAYPSATCQSIDGGLILGCEGFKYAGMATTDNVDFFFNSNGLFAGYSVSFSPKGMDYEYPEVMNMYFAIRDALIMSGEYDSVAFVYKFKSPFSALDEDDAKKGDFTGMEDNALKQDRSDEMSAHRFGKVWSIFQSKRKASVKCVIQVAENLGVNGRTMLHVYLKYKDTEFTNGGYVRGIESTYLLGEK